MYLTTVTTGEWLAIGGITITVIGAILGFVISTIKKQVLHGAEIGFIKDGFLDIKGQIRTVDDKLEKYLMRSLAEQKSPLQLTDDGLKIFNRENIQEFVSNVFDEVVNRMKQEKYDSSYQAQDVLFRIVGSYKTSPEYQVMLENEAYNTGQHIDILMKLISIGIRDKVFDELDDCDVDEIDLHDSSRQEKS